MLFTSIIVTPSSSTANCSTLHIILSSKSLKNILRIMKVLILILVALISSLKPSHLPQQEVGCATGSGGGIVDEKMGGDAERDARENSAQLGSWLRRGDRTEGDRKE